MFGKYALWTGLKKIRKRLSPSRFNGQRPQCCLILYDKITTFNDTEKEDF